MRATIAGSLDCEGSIFRNPNGYALAADRVTVEGSINMRAVRAEGKVRLPGASIRGNLECQGSSFSNSDGYALDADAINVEGYVLMGEGFRAEGVKLLGARIRDNLECDGSTLWNPDGHALNADGVKVEGSMHMRSARAEGEVWLPRASIGGNLECDQSTFRNPNGYALNGDGMKVEGGVFLRGGSWTGGVRLLRARIGGDLDCERSIFVGNRNRYALAADGAKVEGCAFLRGGFGAQGRVSFVGVSIAGHFQWHRIVEPKGATLDLGGATVHTLWDEKASWPNKGHLYLKGFEYEQIAPDGPHDTESRLKWLGLQPEFDPQPYGQLARVLRTAGHERGARQILIARETDRRQSVREADRERRRTKPWWRRFGSWLATLWRSLPSGLFGFTLGYGYQPERAFRRFAPLFLVGGAVLFSIGRDLFTPTGVGPYASDAADNVQYNSEYPPLDPIVYSIDAFVPIINLHQESHWLPNPNRKPSASVPWLSGSALRYYHWVHICFGWLLSFLLVAGLSGLVRKE